nr:MAG TPA: hypothetical protein [Bacteriophage sp.]
MRFVKPHSFYLLLHHICFCNLIKIKYTTHKFLYTPQS